MSNFPRLEASNGTLMELFLGLVHIFSIAMFWFCLFDIVFMSGSEDEAKRKKETRFMILLAVCFAGIALLISKGDFIEIIEFPFDVLKNFIIGTSG